METTRLYSGDGRYGCLLCRSGQILQPAVLVRAKRVWFIIYFQTRGAGLVGNWNDRLLPLQLHFCLAFNLAGAAGKKGQSLSASGCPRH